MVSRPNFGRVGYLRGPKWAPNEHKSIFWAFFVYIWCFLLTSLILWYLCDWNYGNTISKGRCSNKMADFSASGYFWGPWTSIISTFCLDFGIFWGFPKPFCSVIKLTWLRRMAHSFSSSSSPLLSYLIIRWIKRQNYMHSWKTVMFSDL